MSNETYPSPNVRRLQIFSFDPALAARYDLAGMSGVTIEVQWEDNLKEGPVGEYVEVIDIDPGSNAAYAPVNLNAPALLATDGLKPLHPPGCWSIACCLPTSKNPARHCVTTTTICCSGKPSGPRFIAVRTEWISRLARSGFRLLAEIVFGRSETSTTKPKARASQLQSSAISQRWNMAA